MCFGSALVVAQFGFRHATPLAGATVSILFTTGRDTVKGRAVRRDPRVALCVDDDRPPFSYVLIEGTAEVGEDLDEMLHWATRIAGRYMGADRAEQFGRRNAVTGELLVRVTPARVVARRNISD